MKTKTISKLVCGLAAGILFSNTAMAQFTFSGQYMSRGEYRHGYSTLSDTNMNAGIFISQRLRVNGEYKHEKFKIYAAMQDVRTWGSVANSAIDNKGLFSLFEGYGELYFTKKITAKIGRQVLSYDDDRILGGLDWTMAARRHDAGVFKYTDSTWAVHVGGAWNQNYETNKAVQYNVAGNYKTFQYLWANKQIKKVGISFLFLNNGMPYTHVDGVTGKKDSITLYTQTTGLRAEYKGNKLGALIYGYYQMGDNASAAPSSPTGKWEKTSAYDVCAEVSYKPVKGLLTTLGGELLSGNSQTDTTSAYRKVNHAFNPLYGTNHRFNGYMDYYYVGNHINTVGLMDIYLRVHYTYKKVMLGVNGHYFNSAAPIQDKRVTTSIKALPANLGGEVDATLSYNFAEGVAIQAGYSQYFGTYSMMVLRSPKGMSLTPKSNWAYISLVIRPGKIAWPKVGLKM